MKDGSKRLKTIEKTVTFVSYCAIYDIPVALVKKWIDLNVSFKKLPPRLQEAVASCEDQSIEEIAIAEKLDALTDAEKNRYSDIWDRFWENMELLLEGKGEKINTIEYVNLSHEDKMFCLMANGWKNGKDLTFK
jgi:hypothetical protein